MGNLSFIPAVVGFWIGILFLLMLDQLIPHLHIHDDHPEEAIISMPLRSEGISKRKAFCYGVLSGIVEPVGSLVTVFLAGLVLPVLPYLLSFAAGSMVYVVVEELVPEMAEGEHSNLGTVFFALGFTIMMVLDVALS